MAYDLLGLTSNTFRYESETAGGKVESKEHILDERDELWVSHGLSLTLPGVYSAVYFRSLLLVRSQRNLPDLEVLYSDN